MSGNVPLSEKAITPEGKGYVWTDLREIERRETCSLCRCGRSVPFCDGMHVRPMFGMQQR